MTDGFLDRRQILLTATALLFVAPAVLGGCQKTPVIEPESDGEDSDHTG